MHGTKTRCSAIARLAFLAYLITCRQKTFLQSLESG